METDKIANKREALDINTAKHSGCFLLISDLTRIAFCSRRYILEEIKRKNLRAYKMGRYLQFDPIDVEKWMKKRAV